MHAYSCCIVCLTMCVHTVCARMRIDVVFCCVFDYVCAYVNACVFMLCCVFDYVCAYVNTCIFMLCCVVCSTMCVHM